jgi:hypothetical protein
MAITAANNITFLKPILPFRRSLKALKPLMLPYTLYLPFAVPTFAFPIYGYGRIPS